MTAPAGAKVIAQGKFLRLMDIDTWEFLDRPGAAGVVDIVAVTDDGCLVLVEQFRPAVGGRSIELPAGLIGDQSSEADENPLDAAARELQEETGYIAGQLTKVAAGAPSPGQSTENVHMFLATGLTKVSAGGGVDDENITVHQVPVARADQWLSQQSANGSKVSLRVYAGLYFALRELAGQGD